MRITGSGDEQARGMLAEFRGELDRCLARHRDVLLEACDAVLGRPPGAGVTSAAALG
jgi:hypothetical protein